MTPEQEAQYNEEMAQKADLGTGVSEDPAENLLAGKYTNEEALGKGILELLSKQNDGNLEAAYKALEENLGKNQQNEEDSADTGTSDGSNGDGTGDSDSAGSDDDPGDVDADTGQTINGLKVDDLTAELAENGKLGEESLGKLSEAGLSEDMVTRYIEGQKAIAKLTEVEMYGDVGGKEAVETMFEWGKSNYSQQEREAFDAAMDSGNLVLQKQALKSLKTAYDAENASLDLLHTGTANSSSATGRYNSLREMVEDQQKPEYKTSAKFRAMVEAKAARSNF